MSDEKRILEAVTRALNDGVGAEAVCVDEPELLLHVRERLTLCDTLNRELDELFPTTPAPAREPLRRPDVPGYDIEGVLGRGGVGVVYRARHASLGRSVALKMLLSGDHGDAIEHARFHREARAFAALHHPNVVQIHEIGQTDGLPFFTMELLEGGTLAERAAGRPFAPREAAALVRTVAEAVQAVHAVGLVHRDLKLANILLTEDGRPKLSDFGLARRSEDDFSLTLDTAPLGTPCYMAPEQAAATPDAARPAVDLYALGVALYELLAGRPPFQATSVGELHRQILHDDPPPPSRINPHVPRDLETICLKCMQKLPAARYDTAQDVADDLGRFLRREPVRARRTGRMARGLKWTRRRPGAATAIATGLLLGSVLTLQAAQSLVGQARRRAAVSGDLQRVAECERAGRWSDAQAAVDRAAARVDGLGPADVLASIDHAAADLKLVHRLDAIRLNRATAGGLIRYRWRSDTDYEKAFADAGWARAGDSPDSVAARIRASPIGGAMLAALDDWAAVSTRQSLRPWLLAIAARVDPASAAAVRDPATWADLDKLDAFARDLPVANRPISPLLAIAERLWICDRDPRPLLRRLQLEHPADFWTNLTLGNALLLTTPAEAGLYYRAALAARPDAAVGYCAVGDSLCVQHQTAEAADYYRKALKLDDQFPRAWTNLGTAERDLGHVDVAMNCYERTLRIDPEYAWADYGIAKLQVQQGQLAEAAVHLDKIVLASPQSIDAEDLYHSVMFRLDRGAVARTAWHEMLIRQHPESYVAWSGYAELCLFLGDENAYRAACHDLLDRFGRRTDPRTAEPLARTCLLLPCDAATLAEATRLARFAAEGDAAANSPYSQYSQFALGLADYRNGNFDAAIDAMSGPAAGVLGPCPGFVTAMAWQGKGEPAKAHHAFDRAVARFDWDSLKADHRDAWICHVLRGQAELVLQTTSSRG